MRIVRGPAAYLVRGRVESAQAAQIVSGLAPRRRSRACGYYRPQPPPSCFDGWGAVHGTVLLASAKNWATAARFGKDTYV